MTEDDPRGDPEKIPKEMPEDWDPWKYEEQASGGWKLEYGGKIVKLSFGQLHKLPKGKNGRRTQAIKEFYWNELQKA